MAEIQNANGLTLLEGLSGMEAWQRSESAVCNAELLKWAQDEIKLLRAQREALIAMVEELAGTISDDEDSTWGHKTDARKLLASLGR